MSGTRRARAEANAPPPARRRKPRLVLSDVLKTEQGKACLERLRQSTAVRNGGHVPGGRRRSDRAAEEPRVCRPTRSSQKEAAEDKSKKAAAPHTTPKSSPSTSSRSRLRRRLQSADADAAEEERDAKEAAESAPSLSVGPGPTRSRESVRDEESGAESYPAGIEGDCGDPGKEQQALRKRKAPQCNGTNTLKRQRESVPPVPGEERGEGEEEEKEEVEKEEEGGVVPSDPVALEGSDHEADLASLEPSIVKFTVGTDKPPEGVPPAPDFIVASNNSLLLSQESSTQTGPAEAIVLSSDEEEAADPELHSLLSVAEADALGQSFLDAVSKSPDVFDALDMQDLEAISLSPTEDSCFMGLAFSTLHCGGHQGTSNGSIMITQENIIIPLKGNATDPGEQMEMLLSFRRKELRRYSIWEQQEMETQDLLLKVDLERPPPAALLFCVSDVAAAAVQQDLLKLCSQGRGGAAAGRASPFILLTLKYPLEGMEGALLRSLLELDCLNSLAEERSCFAPEAERLSLDYMYTPVLSLDDSIELVRRSGLDSPLLRLMDLESPEPECEPGADPERDGPPEDVGPGPVSQDEADLSPEAEVELEAETGTRPGEDHEEQVPDTQRDKGKHGPVYTVCRRWTRGAYSVSLCEADSRWTKYKHRGLTQRLIQFPPPPLKGGITVTMEDLQCLDSGLFLNDVIIDFYLKYLLHNASASVTERCHIFSSFFYKQLTRRDNASEGGVKNPALSCQKQRRHQRVKTWTRHVDIFDKDFLFVPVNQEAHWYLAVICFPGLTEPKTEDWSGPSSLGGSAEDREAAQGSRSPGCRPERPATPPSRTQDAATDTDNAAEQSSKNTKPGPVKCTEQTYQSKTVCKRPCILIMDSLKRSPHERVFRLLRDYLESEWEVRRSSARDFGPDHMQSSHCLVPLQDNTSDCGLYLLQYVESFLKDPVVHFDLPLQLESWFPRRQIRRKRDEIRDLVLNLYRRQRQDGPR